MSTIKISELNEITQLNSNTSNTILVGVDLPSSLTGKITATTLSRSLYAYNPLIVGNNLNLFPNTISQFSGNSITYLQSNLQNFTNSGSGDYIITADTGTNSNSYIDLGINNSNFSDSSYSSMNPYDGYLYVSGPSTSSYSGNLIVGTASSYANIVFIAGGTQSGNVIGNFSKSSINLYQPTTISQSNTSSSSPGLLINNYGTGYSLVVNDQTSDTSPFVIDVDGNVSIGTTLSGGYKLFVNGKSYFQGDISTSGTISFSDGSSQSSAASNTWLQANDLTTLTNAKSYTDTANNYIKSNYLANTTGSFNGSLTVKNNLTTNGTVLISNTNFSSTSAAVIITASNNTVQQSSADGYMLHISGKYNVPTRMIADSFGASSYPAWVGRAARGNVEYPAPVQTNDILTRFSSSSYGTTGYTVGGVSRIDFIATENHTDTSKGSRIEFWNTANNTNTISKIATFNANEVSFTGTVNPQKGFIYSPNTVSSNVTSYSIDMANNSIYKMSCNNALTLSVTGFQAGKVTEVWLTHYGNTNDAITHGCVSGNATKTGTSFNVNIPTLVYLRYFSVGSDLANTYVSINYG